MPDLLHLVGIELAQARHRGLGEARREADAQAPGDEFDQRPAPGGIEPVEPIGDDLRQLGLGRDLQRLDDGGEIGRRGIIGPLRPDQRDGLGEIADIVVGETEEHGIGAGGRQLAEEPGLGMAEDEIAGEGGECIAAVGIGRGGEIIRDQPQLGIALGLVGELIEESGRSVSLPPLTPRRHSRAWRARGP